MYHRLQLFFIINPSAVFHSIFRCVAHLYVRFIAQQKKPSSLVTLANQGPSYIFPHAVIRFLCPKMKLRHPEMKLRHAETQFPLTGTRVPFISQSRFIYLQPYKCATQRKMIKYLQFGSKKIKSLLVKLVCICNALQHFN